MKSSLLTMPDDCRCPPPRGMPMNHRWWPRTPPVEERDCFERRDKIRLLVFVEPAPSPIIVRCWTRVRNHRRPKVTSDQRESVIKERRLCQVDLYRRLIEHRAKGIAELEVRLQEALLEIGLGHFEKVGFLPSCHCLHSRIVLILWTVDL